MSYRESGQASVRSNVGAALALTQVVAVTLGPYGLDRLLVDPKGNFLITNDGATLLECLDIEHPVGILMAELSRFQDNSVGDGTSSVVLLAGKLLQAGGSLVMDQGVHPGTIVLGLEGAARVAVELADSIAIAIDSAPRQGGERGERGTVTAPLNLEEALTAVVRTSMGSKVIRHAMEHLVGVVVRALLKANVALQEASLGSGGKAQRWNAQEVQETVELIKRPSASMGETELVDDGDGILLELQVLPTSPTEIVNAVVASGRFSLQSRQQSKFWASAQATGDGEGEAASLAEFERQLLIEQCEALIALGVNVVVCHGPVAAEAEAHLTSRGIMVVANASFKGCATVCRATGCAAMSSLAAVTSAMLGHAGRVMSRCIGSHDMLQMSGINGRAQTILLRAPTGSMLDEVERSIHDALCAGFALLHTQRVVAGAGAVEFELAARLRELAVQSSTSNADHMGMTILADALEAIPLTLAQNAGLDAPMLVAQGRKVHQGAAGACLGVDLQRGCLRDMVITSPRVIEPVQLIQCMIRAACQCAMQILRIDENIMLEPRKQFSMGN